MNHPTNGQERAHIFGLYSNPANNVVEVPDLSINPVQILHLVLILNNESVLLLLELLVLVDHFRQLLVLLKLVETTSNDVLRVCIFQTQGIQQHIVLQMERAV